jgi:menaquinone-dependent protoporphyrinogen oxidase
MTTPHVLVAYGSRHGSTTGIAETVADELRHRGCIASVRPASTVKDLVRYDAVVLGGALYAGHWHADARHFAHRFRQPLSMMPLWLFSSGPLDDSASDHEIGPVRGVERLRVDLGGRGHATFGGCLQPDVEGVIASRMAREHSGDHRDERQIREWAGAIASELLPVHAH